MILDPCPPQPRRRRRLERTVRRLRSELRRSRHLTVGLAVALLLALTVTTGMVSAGDAPAGSTVELGTGEAGVAPPAAAPRRATAEPVAPAAQTTTPQRGRKVGEGEASYYHASLEGHATASGEPYRGARLTAAHRSLPFGSKVRVTNLKNGRSVTVKVNDRGPFVPRRVIDLSRAAARQLGMLERGHARVKLELIAG